MKRFKNFYAGLFALALAAGLVLNFGGCLNNVPVAPEAKSEHKILVLGTGSPSLKKVVPVSQKVTRKDGGELILDYKGLEHNNGNVEVKIILFKFKCNPSN